MKEQLDKIETKIDKLHKTVCDYMITQEARTTRLEVVQRAFLWIAVTAGTGTLAYVIGLF